MAMIFEYEPLLRQIDMSGLNEQDASISGIRETPRLHLRPPVPSDLNSSSIFFLDQSLLPTGRFLVPIHRKKALLVLKEIYSIGMTGGSGDGRRLSEKI